MYVSTSLLWIALASLPNGGTPKAPAYDGPLRTKVLDVFAGDRLLVALGSEQGARKGMKCVLTTMDKQARPLFVEIVEVGANYSVMQQLFNRRGLAPAIGTYDVDLDFFGGIRQPERIDWIFRRGSEPTTLPLFPGYFEPGGALIDLTTPNGAKMLPRGK